MFTGGFEKVIKKILLAKLLFFLVQKYCYSTTYEVGDILLKIKYSARIKAGDTHHHAMLVLGESTNGLPYVAHMTFPPTRTTLPGSLQIEELKRGKDLTLLKPKWSPSFKKALAVFFTPSEARKKILQSLTMSRENFTRKVLQVSLNKKLTIPYLKDLFQSKQDSYLRNLQEKFNRQNLEQEPIDLICHEFVVNILHYIAYQNKEPIPSFLQILPENAWSFKLLEAARSDGNVEIIDINRVMLPAQTKVTMKMPQYLKHKKASTCLIM